MKLNNLKIPKGAKAKDTKRLGRGRGTGQGCTAGRGHKGQNSRSGGKVRRGFEGGQMPLIRRVPKRGFYNKFRTLWEIVNLSDIERMLAVHELPEQGEITPEVLKSSGLVRKSGTRVKILGDGELSKAIKIKAHAFSRTAREKIINASGTAEVILK